MKKITILLSTLLLSSMLLSACGAVNAVQTMIPSMTVPTNVPAGTQAAATQTPAATEGKGTPGIPVTGAENPARLSKQLGFTVWNKDGKQIGTVKDMVLDFDNNKITYVVVGAGGFLGIGEKDVLVPWNSLKLEAKPGDANDKRLDTFVLQGDQDRFTNAPGVDVHSLVPKPGNPARDWDNAIRKFWQTGKLPSTPAPSETPNPNLTATAVPQATGTPEATAPTKLKGVMLASDALHASVRLGGNGDKEAKVSDMIVNPDNGKVQYLVVEYKFDDGEHLIPVPLKALQWDPQKEAFILNVDEATLKGAPTIKEDQYPDTSKSNWDKEFAKFWQGVKLNAPTSADATPTP